MPIASGAWKLKKNKSIYYSLVNFLSTKSSKFEDWHKGIVLEVEILKDKSLLLNLFLCNKKKTDFKLSLTERSILINLEKQFKTYSEIIRNESELKFNWGNYILEKYNLYDNYWSPLSFIKNKLIKKVANRKGKALFLNLMHCDAHFDMSKEILNKKIKE